MDELLYSLRRVGPPMQVPVQRAAVARILERVANPAAELDAFRLSSLAEMRAHWPGGTDEMLVRRLEEGHDRGYALGALAGFFVRAQRRFEPMRSRLFVALTRRCGGVQDEELVAICERALWTFDPSGRAHRAIGGVGSRCGRISHLPPPGPGCIALRARWDHFVERVPQPEDYALASHVEDAAPEHVVHHESSF